MALSRGTPLFSEKHASRRTTVEVLNMNNLAPTTPNPITHQPSVQAQPSASAPNHPLYIPYSDPVATAQAYQLGSQAIAATQAYTRAMIENTRLRDRLARKELAEAAYTTSHINSGRTYTTSASGRAAEVLNAEIERANRVDFRPPYSCRKIYVITLRGYHQPLVVDAKSFDCDRLLVQAFRELPRIQVRCCRTIRQTADLLRQAIAEHLEVIQPAFWGGWLLWIMFHTAAMYSLLQQLGYPFPLAFGFLVENVSVRSSLENLFAWYGDAAISTHHPSEIVTNELLR